MKLKTKTMPPAPVTTQTELAIKAYRYVREQLTETTFLQFVSIFESFCFDLLSLWLTAYPQSLNKKMVDLETVMELSGKEAVLLWIVQREVNQVLYEKPSEWFAYLENRAKLGCPSKDEIDRIAEAKASRDVLVHNRGIANRIYETKAGRLARFQEGEKVSFPEGYHRATWDLIRKIVSDLSNAVIAKTA